MVVKSDRHNLPKLINFKSAATTDIKLTKPVYVGDTLYAESEISSKRKSKSRPNAGLVSVITRGLKAGREKSGELVEFMKYRRTFLVPFRGHWIEDQVNY